MMENDLRRAVAHLMEGDVPNARYWYRRAGRALRDDVVIGDEIAALSETLKG